MLNILERDLTTEAEKPATKQAYKGLSSSKAADLLDRYGKNLLKQAKAVSPFHIFVNQYKDILTLILLISTGVSLFLGEYVEAVAIAIIVLMNGVMGFIQEFKTEKTLEALRNMAAPMANVYRDGEIMTIPAEDVVVGDVILVEAGDRVCADAVLLECSGICADESILTGESQSVVKIECPDGMENSVANELNQEELIYMGTTITKGHGEAQVISTGMDTQMGKIADMLHNIEQEETQLQKKLAQLGKYIAIGCLLICAIVSVTGILRGEPILSMLITGVSLAVAAVPEGLPAIVTIALALAVGRMVKQRALVRKLHAVETLGCTNVICSDKTGTLTENNMTVTEIYSMEGSEEIHDQVRFSFGTLNYTIALCGLLCNNAKVHAHSEDVFGEATETALIKFARKVGIRPAETLKEYKRLNEIPFDSKRKCMSLVVSDMTGQKYMFTKGAYDVMLEKCLYIKTEAGEKLLSADLRRVINSANERMARKALRVIGVAYKKLGVNDKGQENDLVFLGLVGMIDPPRKEAKKAVATCSRAGIKTVMITGDHKITACAIAKEIGIYHQNDMVLTGSELDDMTPGELERIIDGVTVFARVSPKHKLMIVDAFQKWGNIVAMTGDGVNDAPAIKQADIGVSMGISGTDVTKEASDVILLDDNFATLVTAVREGRVIYSNIRKFIRYLLSCNIGEVITMFLGMLMGMPVVLMPIQILMINLVTDGLPAIALGLEPPDRNSMNNKPRKKSDGIFSDGLLSKIVFRGIFIGLSTLATFVTIYKMSESIDTARTGAYFTLIVTQLINVFECKSEKHSIFHINLFNNRKLLGAAFISLTILVLTIYFAPLQFIMGTISLTVKQVLIACSFCVIPSVMSIIFLHNANTGVKKYKRD